MEEKKKVTFSDYLSILLKWRKFLIINMFIIGIISLGISFAIPKTYKATSTLSLSSSSESGMSGLGALLSGGNSALSMGAKLLGVTSGNEDIIYAILNSRSLLAKVVKKYNLVDYYSTSDSSIDRTINSFLGDAIFDASEYGFIQVSVIYEDPVIAAEMVNYIVSQTDSINIEFNILQAKRNREFIEKRFIQNKNDLKGAEEEFAEFQKKYGVFSVEDQIKMSVEISAEVEAQLLEKQIALSVLKNQVNPNPFMIKSIEDEINAVQHEVNKIRKGESNIDLMIPFKDVPDLQVKYLRLFREIEIQTKVLEFIYPLYEQALMDENKSMPTLFTIDEAVPPDMKYGPKRALIILGISSLFFFLFLFIVTKGENIISLKEPRNRIQEMEISFYNSLIKFYKLRF